MTGRTGRRHRRHGRWGVVFSWMIGVMLVAQAPRHVMAQAPGDEGATPQQEQAGEAGAVEEAQAPLPYAEHDPLIDRHLGALFGQIKGLSAVTHRVEAGLVTLDGKVAELEQRQRAEQIASRLQHVIAVQNLILVTGQDEEASEDADARAAEAAQTQADEAEQALTEKLKGIFNEIEGLQGVKVKVRSGIVTLSGEVLNDDERKQAVGLTEKVEGVLYVIDNLTVPTEISERVRPAFKQVQDIVKNVVEALPLLAIALALLILSWMLARAVRNWEWPYRKLEERPLIREIVRQVVSTGVFIAGLLLIFELLDVTAFIGALLGTAGLAGLAVGFAFQDIVENYLSSLMLSARQPYKKGDVVQVGDHLGKIVRMTMRDTVLMTFDGNHVRIPNAQVFKSVLTNYTHNPRRRFSFKVGVGTQENLLEVRRLGLDALRSIDGVMKDPAPFMTIDELGDSSVICTFYGWVDQRSNDFTAVRSEAVRRVKVTFDKEGFDMPEPIYRIQVTERAQEAIGALGEGSGPVVHLTGSEATAEGEEAATRKKRHPEEPIEDDTMEESINEDKHLDSQIAETDDREKENLL